MMKGYIYTMYQGADPGKGWVLNDPIFGKKATLGACMTNVRRVVSEGDYIFSISGRIKNVSQYIVGGFSVEKKINALAARDLFPENILRKEDDGTIRGNIIVDENGNRIKDDNHSNWERRLENYIVGNNPIYFETEQEIEKARKESTEILKEIFKSKEDKISKIIGRCRKLEEKQIEDLMNWMKSIKV